MLIHKGITVALDVLSKDEMPWDHIAPPYNAQPTAGVLHVERWPALQDLPDCNSSVCMLQGMHKSGDHDVRFRLYSKENLSPPSQTNLGRTP